MKRVMTKEELLQEAVEAGQNGELARARALLLDLLREDNREPLYWLLMSTAVESQEERIYCLQNVLLLDPDNSAARHDLELLGADVSQENAQALLPEEQEDWQTTEIAAPKIPKKGKRQEEEAWSISWIFGTLGIGLVVILLGYYAATNGFLDLVLGNTQTATITGRAESLISQATDTQAVGGTPTREIAGVPRDPSDLLDATYTPTPRYVGTPHTDNAAFQQGLDALDAEDYSLAIAAFQEYLASNPQSPDAAYYLGEAHLRKGEFEAALDAFELSLDIDPQFAPAYLGLGRLGIAQEADSVRIIADLNTALLLDQNLIDAYLERAGYNLMRGNVESGADDVAAAEERAPQSAIVQYYKARVALAQENYSSALTASQRALDLDVTLLPNYLALAEAQQGLGQYAASIQTMKTYLNFQTTGRGWELLGLGFQLDGEADLALEAFNRALELDPNLARSAYYRGLAEQAGGNDQAALNFFRIAVTGVPNWFEAHIGLAEGYLAVGNPSAAFFEVNIHGNLVETDAQRAAFFYLRALSLDALGQTENAVADWRSLLSLPTSAVPAEWRAEAEERVQS